jgi:hypothetical protein
MYYECIYLARRVICVGWLAKYARTRGRDPRYSRIKSWLAGYSLQLSSVRLGDSNLWGDPLNPVFLYSFISSGSPLLQAPVLFIILLLYFSPPWNRAGEFQLCPKNTLYRTRPKIEASRLNGRNMNCNREHEKDKQTLDNTMKSRTVGFHFLLTY